MVSLAVVTTIELGPLESRSILLGSPTPVAKSPSLSADPLKASEPGMNLASSLASAVRAFFCLLTYTFAMRLQDSLKGHAKARSKLQLTVYLCLHVLNHKVTDPIVHG